MSILRSSAKLFVLAVMLITSFCGSESQDNEAQVKYADYADISALAVRLVSSKRTYSLKENLVLDAAVHNVRSYRGLFLYYRLGWGRGSGMSLTIEDVHGNQIKTLAMDDLPFPPPPPDDANILVRLPVGRFFGISLAQPVHDFISKPGRYRLRATYSSVLSRESVDSKLRQLPVVWIGHEPIDSPWITIEITP